MQDLLAIGEAFAELDLVVRQQADGSLTLAVDDGARDGDRVRVVADDRGVEASLRLAKARELTRELAQALDRLNGDPGPVRFVWRRGEVRTCAHLAWGQRPFAENQLRVLFGALGEAESRYGNPLRAALEGQGAWGSLHDSAEALPPSYLAGAGQPTSEDGLTQRYGSLANVPGRAESGRVARPPASERAAASAAGAGAGRWIGLLVLVLVGAGAVAGWFVTRGGAEQAAATPSPGPTGPGDADPAGGAAAQAGSDGDAPSGSDGDDPSGSDGDDPSGSDGEPDWVVVPSPTPASLDLDVLLEAVRGHPARRPALVARWHERGLDREAGARRRMLQALGGDGDYDPDVGRVLLQSLREHPLDPYEAMDCFDLTQSGLRRELLEVLGRARGQAAQDAIAFLEARRGDDVRLDETLLTLGAGGAEAFLAVLEVRGREWATIGHGQVLLRGLAERDLLGLRPLLASPDEALRVQVLTVIRDVEGQDEDALRVFAGCLDDPAPAVRQHAVQGIVGLADAKASWALARALVREADDQTADALRAAFLRLPSDATVDLLSRLYRKREPEERVAAVRGLEATQTARGVAALLSALADPELEVRRAALEGLESSHKRNPDLRPAVAEGLGAIRELALSGDDPELIRLAKSLHVRIAGSLPR